MPRLLTETEAATLVGMSVHWLRRKRWEGGGIPYIKMAAGGAVRYSEESIAEYLDSHNRTCTREQPDEAAGQMICEGRLGK